MGVGSVLSGSVWARWKAEGTTNGTAKSVVRFRPLVFGTILLEAAVLGGLVSLAGRAGLLAALLAFDVWVGSVTDC